MGSGGISARNTAAANASTMPNDTRSKSSFTPSARTENAPHTAQHGHHRPGKKQRRQHAAAAQYHTFCQQRTSQCRCSGSECRTHGQLRVAANRSRQHQVSYVGARNTNSNPAAANNTHKIALARELIWSCILLASIR